MTKTEEYFGLKVYGTISFKLPKPIAYESGEGMKQVITYYIEDGKVLAKADFLKVHKDGSMSAVAFGVQGECTDS